MGTFQQLLLNTLVSGVTSTFLWFALTFWVYLETRSVVATGVIGGAYGIASAAIGPAFGTYVDHHRKHTAMVLATSLSAACFGLATIVFVAVDADELLRLDRPWFWILVGATLAGSVAGMMRSIAMSTCVTLLVPEDRRDRANGMVGTVTGVSFAVTSVFSGLVLGQLRHGVGALRQRGAHGRLPAPPPDDPHREPEPERTEGEVVPKVDVRGALDAIHAVPGLGLLIALAAFNNLLMGVFMALMDAYGLELVSVETWGFLWGLISLAMIVGGIVVARRGLGPRPLRLIIVANLVNWTLCATFALRSSIVPLVIGDVRLLGADPRDRGRRADGAPAVDPVRAAGSRVRLRPARGERRRPDHRVHDRPVRGDLRDAVHDRRSRRRRHRRLVRHRTRPRVGAHVHRRRPHRDRRHAARVRKPVLPPAQR